MNLVIASVILVVLAVTGQEGWILFGLLWLLFAAAAIWAWTRRYTLYGTVGVQLGTAEAGPYAGRHLVVIHDGTTWTVEIASPHGAEPRTLTFDNDEFADIRERWQIRWTAP